MTKKTPVDPDDLMNELRGKSTYFAQKGDRTDEQTNERIAEQDSEIAAEVVNQTPERLTKRMSFEGYIDHEETIREIQHAYYKKTGRDLPSSRIIREALEKYLPKLLKALSGEED